MIRRGFTLIELITALIIASALAAATTQVISGSLRTRSAVEARAQASQRALLAVEQIARDVENIVRDLEADNTLLRVLDERETGSAGDELLVFTRSDHRARPLDNASLGFPGTGEGGTYEAHVRLEIPVEPTDLDRDVYDLWRRVDPVPDVVVDGGGVARVLGRGITALELEVFDGADWQVSWDSDRDGLPYAFRVTVSATDDEGGTERTVRRTVGIDRTPLPTTSSEPLIPLTPGDLGGGEDQ